MSVRSAPDSSNEFRHLHSPTSSSRSIELTATTSMSVSSRNGVPDAQVTTAGIYVNIEHVPLEQLREQCLKAYPELDFPAPVPFYLDVLPHGWSKAEALDALMDSLGITLDEVAFVGDSENDLTLLKKVPNSYAVANRMPERIRGLALHYPAFCIPDDIRARFASAADVSETFFSLSMDVGSRFTTDALELDPYAMIGTYAKDVLITHGSADDLVDVSHSRHAARTYAHAELHVIDGAGHGFQGPALAQATAWLAAFLERHVTRSQPPAE